MATTTKETHTVTVHPSLKFYIESDVWISTKQGIKKAHSFLSENGVKSTDIDSYLDVLKEKHENRIRARLKNYDDLQLVGNVIYLEGIKFQSDYSYLLENKSFSKFERPSPFPDKYDTIPMLSEQALIKFFNDLAKAIYSDYPKKRNEYKILRKFLLKVSSRY
jgi:hypothetical protein